jgi:hypothetical protein
VYQNRGTMYLIIKSVVIQATRFETLLFHLQLHRFLRLQVEMVIVIKTIITAPDACNLFIFFTKNF